jgi:hypothetical protein
MIAPPLSSVAHPAHALAAGIALTLSALLDLIFFRPARFGAYATPLHHRIRRAASHLALFFARLATGRFPPPRKPRPADAPKSAGGPQAAYLPRRPAWLIATGGHQVAGLASQFHTALHAPESRALLAQAPAHARRALARRIGALCRLLGIPLPDPLQQAGPRPRPGRPRRAPPARACRRCFPRCSPMSAPPPAP